VGQIQWIIHLYRDLSTLGIENRDLRHFTGMTLNIHVFSDAYNIFVALTFVDNPGRKWDK
jgi:hypothetical protein